MNTLHRQVAAEATDADQPLAHLLMRAAFDDDGEKQALIGLAPLYLQMAFVIRRAPELRQALLAALAGEN